MTPWEGYNWFAIKLDDRGWAMRRGTLRGFGETPRCNRPAATALLALLLLNAGCGSGSVGSPVTTASTPAATPTSATAGTPPIPPPPPDGANEAMSLKYQGTFVRAARDCAVVSGEMVMRVGVQGRIIVGPAGGPGQV